MDNIIKINRADNVAVALNPVQRGQQLNIDGVYVTALSDIPANFKVALCDIAEGQHVIKYGFSIGIAKSDVAAGEVVHTHNLRSALAGAVEYETEPAEMLPPVCSVSGKTFKGYLRSDGKIAVRNEIFILPTVGCVNEVCDKIAQRAIKISGKQDIHVFKHPYGCSQLGDDHLNTQKILSGLCRHPNAGGVLVVSLGCENNNLTEFKKVLGSYDPQRVRFMVAQQSGDEVEDGALIVEELAAQCAKDTRTNLPLSSLVIGLKCGGSDALSGITANPLAGSVCDSLAACGGGVIMTEVPEMFGAEQVLMQRSVSHGVYSDIIKMVNDFKKYYIDHGESVSENPSPGNKEGGITTLEEKSLGCVQKGGSAPVEGVIDYGGAISGAGLYLLNGPGNDIVAQTALSAAGAHIILFTTGRGTPLGAPVPTIKISTNSALAQQKPHWIDFDAGRLLAGESMASLTAQLIDLIIDIAEGKLTRNEENGYREIAIWKGGVTL